MQKSDTPDFLTRSTGLLEEATVKNWGAIVITNRKYERFEISGCLKTENLKQITIRRFPQITASFKSNYL